MGHNLATGGIVNRKDPRPFTNKFRINVAQIDRRWIGSKYKRWPGQHQPINSYIKAADIDGTGPERCTYHDHKNRPTIWYPKPLSEGKDNDPNRQTAQGRCEKKSPSTGRERHRRCIWSTQGVSRITAAICGRRRTIHPLRK